MRKQALIVAALVFLLRLPFLNQAMQGDDFYYLAAAKHAQTEPLHPHHAKYVFLGIPMDMRGHPHPPGNAWILGGVLALAGSVREIPFHAVYILFSLVAALSMLSLARRLLPDAALEATLLFCAVPAFIVSGNSLWADMPFLAFWMLSMALCVALEARPRLLPWAALSIAAASLVAYQGIMLAPVLGFYYWQTGQLKRRWWLLAIPFAVVGGFQLFERIASGALPAAILNGHFRTYGLQRLEMKIKNAAGLTCQVAWMMSPVLGVLLVRHLRKPLWILPTIAMAGAAAYDPNPLFWASAGLGVALLTWMTTLLWDAERRFLAGWFLAFFAFSLVVFFAGAARYLLPAAAPLALLCAGTLQKRPGWLRTGIVLNLVLGLAMAFVNYQHWGEYRRIIRESMPHTAEGRVWVNAEWGLRHYAEEAGAKPLVRGEWLRPGDYLINSALVEQIPYSHAGSRAAARSEFDVTPSLPLRLMGLGSRAGYETVGFGLRPFDLTGAAADRVTISELLAVPIELSWLSMNSPQAESQAVQGVFGLEENKWRWMAGSAEFLLKPPPVPSPLAAEFFIPDAAPGRTVTLELNGKEVARQTFARPGVYRLESKPLEIDRRSALVTLSIDQEFSAPGDSRRLGMVVIAVGFPPAK